MFEITPVITPMRQGVETVYAVIRQKAMALIHPPTMGINGGQAMKTNASAVVVVKPGPLGDALQSLVMAVVWSEIVYQARDVSTALPIIAEHHPALVMLDTEKELSHECIWAAVSKMQAASPDTWYVVLVEDLWQQQAAPLAGVDAILLKRWLPAARLLVLLEQLLSR